MKSGDHIGPYRVERLLGAGGMGVVYLAVDERLDRRVALKRLSPDRLGDPDRRRRFRNEARAAARLSHPCVVHLYDVLEADDGDTLVMEYVPGVTLAERIRPAPLGVDAALDVAAQVADGLAAAHAAGLIHRDLKTENVLVTDDGRAKILDFGLALAAGDGGTRLTGAGLAVGTCRAMSPEQARGEELDARSDLFALGVLLHEVVTGASPFAAATAAETLLRVCTHEPPALHEMTPGVPAEATRLAQRLLAKEPARRPASASEAAAALRRARASSARNVPAASGSAEAPTVQTLERAVLPRGPRRFRAGLLAAVAATAAAGALLMRALVPPSPDVRVAVPRVALSADAASPATPGDLGLRAALLAGLVDLEGVRVLAPEEVDAVDGPPRAVARAAAADELMTARLDCAPGQCRVTLARVRGDDGAITWTHTFATDPARPLLLRAAVDGHLRAAFAERRPRRGARPLEVSPDVYAEFVELSPSFERAVWTRDVLDERLRRLQALRARAPRFVELRVVEARTLVSRFVEERDPADLVAAAALLEEAAAVDPADPRVASVLATVHIAAQRLDAAAAAIETLERLSPGDTEALLLRGRLAEKRGDVAGAFGALEAAVSRHPSWRNLYRLAALESRHGRAGAARARLERILQIFPDSAPAQSLLAELELLGGDPQRALALYSRLAERDGGTAELSNLGLAQLLLRRFAEAEATFARAAALAPRHAVVALNHADAAALARGPEASAPLYSRAIALTRGDPAAHGGDLPEWQLASVRAQALAHLGRRREAVAEAQEVLRVAGDRPQAQFEIALVYAVAGERTSALVSVSKALEGGVQARWFDLPAFDALRAAPDFEALLAPRRVR